eukprot:319209_1
MSKFTTLLVFWMVISGTTTASIDEKSSSEVSGQEKVDWRSFKTYFDDFKQSAEHILSVYADGDGDFRSTDLTPLTPNFLTESLDDVLDGFRMLCLLELLDHKRLSELLQKKFGADWDVMNVELDNYIDAILTWVDRHEAKSKALGISSSEQKTKLTEELKTVLDYLEEKFKKHNNSLDTFPKQADDFSGFYPKKLDLDDFRSKHTIGAAKRAWFEDNL